MDSTRALARCKERWPRPAGPSSSIPPPTCCGGCWPGCSSSKATSKAFSAKGTRRSSSTPMTRPSSASSASTPRCSGHWRRGKELMRRAMALNPSYPSYYHWAFCPRPLPSRLATRKRSPSIAASTSPAIPSSRVLLVAILGHLGRTDEAAVVLEEVSSLVPDSTPRRSARHLRALELPAAAGRRTDDGAGRGGTRPRPVERLPVDR